MSVLFLIVLNVIVPVFFLIGAGAILHRKFKLDMNTLSKLNHFLLMPAISFVNIYQSDIGGGMVVQIFSFLALQAVSLIIVSTVVAKLARFDQSLSATFKNSVVLNNSANFGLPVSQMVFHGNPLGLSIQVIVIIFQNLLSYTYGLMNSVSVHTKSAKGAIREFLKNPIIYALLLGFLLQAASFDIPLFLWTPIDNIASAFIAIALITLGAQSAYLKITHFPLPLILSLIGRLILSPSIAFLIILMLGLEGTVAQGLFIASSFPTSRNSALFALEYDNHPEYAAQAVLMSTVFSCITVTLVVYLSKILF